ncbi:MAG: LLM class flavin-dependent oxidoreductase, partial [Mycobacterium sp.]
AIATIARISGGRFRACFGTGGTARRTMGQRPLTLRHLGDYVTAVRGLLAGQIVTIDGQAAQMLHAEGLAPERPVSVELWLSAFGPRAVELATQVADGIIGLPRPHPLPTATMLAGTVLDAHESPDSDRVREAVGPWKVVAYHEAYAIGGAPAVDAMPGGRAWREALENLAPPAQRHLLTHEGHVTQLSERDRPLVEQTTGYPVKIGDADSLATALTELAAQGVREVIYTPSGPDVARELETFSAAAGRVTE